MIKGQQSDAGIDVDQTVQASLSTGSGSFARQPSRNNEADHQ
jgi:hypothetical protein